MEGERNCVFKPYVLRLKIAGIKIATLKAIKEKKCVFFYVKVNKECKKTLRKNILFLLKTVNEYAFCNFLQ